MPLMRIFVTSASLRWPVNIRRVAGFANGRGIPLLQVRKWDFVRHDLTHR
jgi:hypothetical protein